MMPSRPVWRIGLTGGIATGKSTAAAWLRQQGYAVVDADAVAHDLMRPGGAIAQIVAQHLGVAYLGEDGVNRKALGERVFSDAAFRQQLNEWTHPLIFQAMDEQLRHIGSTSNGKRGMLFADIPLLFETDARRRLALDRTWLVVCRPQIQLARLQRRNGWTLEEAQQRIASQMPLEEKRRRADCCIENNTTLDDFFKALQAALLREEKILQQIGRES